MVKHYKDNTRMKVSASDKRTSLLHYGINYGCRRFIVPGPKESVHLFLKWSMKCLSNPICFAQTPKHTHTHTHTHTYTHTHTHEHTHIHIQTHTHEQTPIHTHIQTRIHKHIYVLMCTHKIQTCTCLWTHAYENVYKHTHAHTH
jgi:hypothetical protein